MDEIFDKMEHAAHLSVRPTHDGHKMPANHKWRAELSGRYNGHAVHAICYAATASMAMFRLRAALKDFAA